MSRYRNFFPRSIGRIVLLVGLFVGVTVYDHRDELGLSNPFISHAQVDNRLDPQPGEIVGRASVIDADTIEIQGQRIRLIGIDAPESDQPCQREGKDYRCGQVAANALDDLIGSQTVACAEQGRDQYKRVLAVCRIAGVELNRWLVQQGHAMAYRRYSMDYAADEDKARVDRRGIWAGGFQEPWEYRQGKR